MFKRFLFVFFAFSLVLTACANGASKAKTYKIGAVNYLAGLEPAYEGLKAGLGELGYEEGKNTVYIYHGITEPTPVELEAEIKALLDENVNMLFTMGTLPAQVAKQVVAGTSIPVIFAPLIDPVGEGVVDSISRPGGNVTGVQNANRAAKALEWLIKIAPETKTVCVFYNSHDEVSLTALHPLPETAAQLGVALTPIEVQTPEEAMRAVPTLPEDASILIVPTPTLANMDSVKKLALERRIPIGAYDQGPANVLFSFSVDWYLQGKQASRLAAQVLKGVKPADLPVETAESYLTINLKQANEIGFEFSDEILTQAHTILR